MRIPEPDPGAADLDRLVRELEEEMRCPDPPVPAPTCSGMSVTDRERERERKDAWDAFLAAQRVIAPGPTYVPVRAWVLAGGPGYAGPSVPMRQRLPIAVAFDLRVDGDSRPFILTVPLVRVEQMIGYLARRNFLWPATFDDERVDRAERSGYDWAPWAGELTPTLFTLPGMLAVDFTGVTRDDVKPQTLNGLVEIAQSLADAARISDGLVRVR